MKLSVSSFFSRYVNHPLSRELSKDDKVKATIATIALGILTLGMAQLYCAARQSRSVAFVHLSHHTLTLSSFFSRYILHPLSTDLSRKEKIEAIVSSVALGILTMGIAHVVCALWPHKNGKNPPGLPARPAVDMHFGLHVKPTLVRSVNELVSLFPYQEPSSTFAPVLPRALVRFDRVGDLVQTTCIDPYYARPLPKKDEVIVRLPEGGKARWITLTADQKIDVNNDLAHSHYQVPKTEWGKDHIDELFMPGGQEPYLPNDPRERYGSDHAARMALFIPVFAYLYAKYDPRVSSVSREEVIVTQILGAGHACARQTEGPNADREDAVLQMAEALRTLGCPEEGLLECVRTVIEEKGALSGTDKFLMARLVQNANVVDSARLRLRGPTQDEDEFRESEKHLDIYKEMYQISSEQNGKLKGELGWIDFQEELDAIRWEMDRLIFETHQQRFRELASLPGKKYFDEIVSTINEERYPQLFAVLHSMEVVHRSEMIEKTIIQSKHQQIVSRFNCWIKNGLETVPTSVLESGVNYFASFPTDRGLTALKAQAEHEIELRHRTKDTFDNLAHGVSRDALREVSYAFAALPYLLKQECRGSLEGYFPYVEQLRTDETAYRMLRSEMLYVQLCSLLSRRAEENPTARASELRQRAEELLELDRCIGAELSDPCIQTACALALEEGASLYLSQQRNREARTLLEIASKSLVVCSSHGLAKVWTASGDLLAENEVVYFTSDCHRVRKRLLRVCEKVIDVSSITEISFELTAQSRQALSKAMQLLDDSQCHRVPAIYPRKVSGKNAYSSTDHPLIIGEEYKITVVDGVEVYVGAEQSKWNQYHLMRVHVRKGMDLQSVQKALSLIGLPSVLMSSRLEDEVDELRARSIAFRFPSHLPSGDPSKDPFTAYEALDPPDQSMVDRDLQSRQSAYVGPNTISLVQPSLAREAWELGARAFGTFIDAGDMEAAGGIIASILQKGFLSSQERFARGIFGLGCAPLYNFESGSADQVFTRVLTKDQFISRYCLDNFAVVGKVFFILDLQAFERMPYSYLHDRGGLRNPHFFLQWFTPEKQEPIQDYKGSERILERPGFRKFLAEQEHVPHPLNETMFDLHLGPQYITRIVVATEDDRTTILRVLRSKGIFDMNGLPIEQAVVATNCLHPGMVPGLLQESYPTKQHLSFEAM